MGGKGILVQKERTRALSTLNNQPVYYGISSYDSNAMKSSNPHSGIYEAKTTRTLDNNGGNPACNQGGIAVVCIKNHPNDSRVKIREDGKVQTLSSRMGTGGGNVPMVMESKASGFNGWQSTTSSMPIIDNGTPPIEATMPPYVCESSDGDIAGTLDANYYKGCGERQGVERTVVAMTTEMTPKIDEKDKSFSLRSRDCKDPQCVAYANEAYDKWSESEKGATLRAPGGVYGGGSENLVSHSIVRRLTPTECERLQNYPDGWTDIGEWYDSKGKKHRDADSPRYKALGNSIALPFWQWMAERMVNILHTDGTEEPSMASLFDGISGFCLVFARVGVRPVFSSEIEEFPIAVAKKHFGDDDLGLEGDYERYL